MKILLATLAVLVVLISTPRMSVCLDSNDREKIVCAGFLFDAYSVFKKNNVEAVGMKYKAVYEKLLPEITPIFNELGEKKFLKIMDEGIAKNAKIFNQNKTNMDRLLSELDSECEKCKALLK